MYLWLIIILVLAVIELSTVNLVTIWFILSAGVALIISYFIDNFILQFGVFVILGIVLLLATRNVLKKWLKVKNVPTNSDRAIGATGIVTESINKNGNGEVKVFGQRWTAFADKAIKEGSSVKILAIEGVKLKVEKIKEEL